MNTGKAKVKTNRETHLPTWAKAQQLAAGSILVT